MSSPHTGRSDYSSSEEDTEDLFASPSKVPSKPKQKTIPTKTSEPQPQRKEESKYDAEAAKEAGLRRELESVKSINAVIEGVVSSLEVANGNMSVCKITCLSPFLVHPFILMCFYQTVSKTVTSASTLLNTWVRILSQTEHNQRLILNPNWKGATQDVADMENEQVLKAQAAERRAAEEERRREDARRKAEDEERQRQAGTVARGARGTRGRGRGVGRTGGLSSGYGANSGSSSTGGRGSLQPPASTRGGSGIGRGTARGRARGVK